MALIVVSPSLEAANATLVLETPSADPCAAPARILVWHSGPLDGYPFDKCSNCYSPPVVADVDGLKADVTKVWAVCSLHTGLYGFS